MYVYENSACADPFLKKDFDKGVLFLLQHGPSTPYDLQKWQEEALNKFETWHPGLLKTFHFYF